MCQYSPPPPFFLHLLTSHPAPSRFGEFCSALNPDLAGESYSCPPPTSGLLTVQSGSRKTETAPWREKTGQVCAGQVSPRTVLEWRICIIGKQKRDESAGEDTPICLVRSSGRDEAREGQATANTEAESRQHSGALALRGLPEEAADAGDWEGRGTSMDFIVLIEFHHLHSL